MASSTGASLKVTGRDLQAIRDSMRNLANHEVLVGIPEGAQAREPDADGKAPPINNATIAFIQDNGAPEDNIPARPFMRPGIDSVNERLGDMLVAAAVAVVKDPKTDVMARLTRVGITAATAIKKAINAGIPPPLSERTLRARANRGTKGRKGAKLELELRDAGWAPSVDFAKPLIDTGQLRNSITFVLRKIRG